MGHAAMSGGDVDWARAVVASARPWLDSNDALRAICAVEGDQAATSASADEALELRFGIGSITKTMTATVLAALHNDGHLHLDDPIGAFLDAGSNGHLTLRQLATHTSGLPRLSPNALEHQGFRDADPYAAFTAELAIAGLQQAEPQQAGQAYSNFGYQILGLALEAATDRSLAVLYRDILWAPLGMDDTVLRDDETDRLAPGTHRGRPVPRWRSPVPGPGGVEVTAHDMARYLTAVIQPPENPTGKAIRLATGGEDDTDCLGWFRTPERILVHDGGEAGVAAIAVVDRANHRAVATLSATHPDEFGQVAVAAVRGTDAPGPPTALDRDHPAWTTFEDAVSAIADNDVDRLVGTLALSYRHRDEAVAAIPAELADLGTAIVTSLRPLPGQPPAALVDLADGRELLLTADRDSHLLAGFIPMEKGETPPW